MRPRYLIIVGAGLLVVAVGGLYLILRPSPVGPEIGGTAPALDKQQFEAGAVTVTIEPVRLDDDGAAFGITLDTHSVELDNDMTQAALDIGGTDWPVVEWVGDGPGSHHREGELRFAAAGPATGTAVLELTGLAEPVEARWEMPG